MSDEPLATGLMGVPLRDQQSTSSCVTQHECAVKPAVGRTFVLFTRGFILTFTVIAGVWAASHPVVADESPVAFIRVLGNQAVSVIRSDMQLFEKAAYFRRMIHQDFDLTGICRFVLGPYWRVASLHERKQFRRLFADRLVRSTVGSSPIP